MQRTQISLTHEERRALDAVSARTGKSVSALIRDAVDAAYLGGGTTADDTEAMRHSFGSWSSGDIDGAEFVEGLRPGRRLNEPQ